MSILQKGTDGITGPGTLLHSPTNPPIARYAVQQTQQHDMRSAQLPDDASAIYFEESLTLNSVRYDMEPVKSEVEALLHQIKNLETGQAAILPALNGLQKPLGSVHSSTGTEPSSLTEDSNGPTRATGQG
jgi:hypothetical protein